MTKIRNFVIGWTVLGLLAAGALFWVYPNWVEGESITMEMSWSNGSPNQFNIVIAGNVTALKGRDIPGDEQAGSWSYTGHYERAAWYAVTLYSIPFVHSKCKISIDGTVVDHHETVRGGKAECSTH